jgi:hypothetical protein
MVKMNPRTCLSHLIRYKLKKFLVASYLSATLCDFPRNRTIAKILLFTAKIITAPSSLRGRCKRIFIFAGSLTVWACHLNTVAGFCLGLEIRDNILGI